MNDIKDSTGPMHFLLVFFMFWPTCAHDATCGKSGECLKNLSGISRNHSGLSSKSEMVSMVCSSKCSLVECGSIFRFWIVFLVIDIFDFEEMQIHLNLVLRNFFGRSFALR